MLIKIFGTHVYLHGYLNPIRCSTGGSLFLQLGLFSKPFTRNFTPNQGKSRWWLLIHWFQRIGKSRAAIGVLTGIFIFQKLNPFKPLIWILDRLTIPAAIGGVFIRTGNFFNSEIVGKYTGSNFGVVFENRGEILQDTCSNV